MEKLIITAAICGAEVLKEHNPAVPYTVEECVREAKSAYNAGASLIHLHVREDDGTPTQSKERFRVIIEAIKKECPDVIIQPSTGGAVGMTNDERLQPTELLPEMATLDCGTLNFGGDDIFENTENTIKYFGQRMIERGIKPELEVFDKSMIEMALRLHRKGYIQAPMHLRHIYCGRYRPLRVPSGSGSHHRRRSRQGGLRGQCIPEQGCPGQVQRRAGGEGGAYRPRVRTRDRHTGRGT